MFHDTINQWKQSNKILFISGDKKGCGKQYLAKKISKDFQNIECSPDKLKENDNMGISIMFGSTKKKLVIYNIDDIKIQKLPKNCSIKIIIIVSSVYNIFSVKKIIKKNFHIHIKYTDEKYVEILQTHLDLPSTKEYLDLLQLYDYNLNSILHNLYNQQKKITDDVYDNSLSLVNGDKIKKFKIKDYFRNPMEYTLIGLHLLDYTKNFQLKDKLKQYRSIIESEQFQLNSLMKHESIFFNFVYPHKVHLSNTHKSIPYTRYISKSMIYIHLEKKMKHIHQNEFYQHLCEYRNDLNIMKFKHYIYKNNIDKKLVKHLIELYDKIHQENNLNILSYL